MLNVHSISEYNRFFQELAILRLRTYYMKIKNVKEKA